LNIISAGIPVDDSVLVFSEYLTTVRSKKIEILILAVVYEKLGFPRFFFSLFHTTGLIKNSFAPNKKKRKPTTKKSTTLPIIMSPSTRQLVLILGMVATMAPMNISANDVTDFTSTTSLWETIESHVEDAIFTPFLRGRLLKAKGEDKVPKEPKDKGTKGGKDGRQLSNDDEERVLKAAGGEKTTKTPSEPKEPKGPKGQFSYVDDRVLKAKGEDKVPKEPKDKGTKGGKDGL
jgi:hypothetical protein